MMNKFLKNFALLYSEGSSVIFMVMDVNSTSLDMEAIVTANTAERWYDKGLGIGRRVRLKYQTENGKEWWNLTSMPNDSRGSMPPFVLKARYGTTAAAPVLVWQGDQPTLSVQQVIHSEREGMDIRITKVCASTKNMEAIVETASLHWDSRGLPRARAIRLEHKEDSEHEWWNFQPADGDETDMPWFTLWMLDGELTFQHYR